MDKFPDSFLWGAATSSYQVEGDNSNCDWWEWEKKTGLKDKSGKACRQYEFYEKDFELAKSLGHNAHRLSIEWSRVEPEEGKFSEREIRHYVDVIQALKKRRLEPVVTLHHFTNPLWLARLGGWENSRVAFYFERYSRKMAEALGENVRFWVTINEPLVLAYNAYLIAQWPPQKKSVAATQRVKNNMARSHILSYRGIHDAFEKNNLAAPMVGIAKNLRCFEPCVPTVKNRLAAYMRSRLYNFNFLDRIKNAGTLDFIGVNYYTRELVHVDGLRPRNLLYGECHHGCSPVEKNILGWDIYPEGLLKILTALKRYGVALLVTENGICARQDTQRWDFIKKHLWNLMTAMNKGANVIGYLYWSLIDNFEWDKGFGPRFGIVEVDYNTYDRTPRQSAYKYKSVCETGRLPLE